MRGALNATNVTTSPTCGQCSTNDHARIGAVEDSGACRSEPDHVEKDAYRVMVGSDAKFMDRLYRIIPRRAAGFIAKQMKDPARRLSKLLLGPLRLERPQRVSYLL